MPYVFFAMPGSKQPWPKSAACWSPASPAIGIPAGIPSKATVSPKTPELGRTSGSMAAGTPRIRRSSGSQRRVWMSKRSVRDAFVGSVAWTRPPVRRWMSHESIVPNAISPASARAFSAGFPSRSQAILLPEK